jgi:predicted phage-related endonuclease
MTVLTIPKSDDKDQWLRDRHPWANASDAAVYVDRHPFKTLGDLVAEKLAPEPVDNGNRHTDRGLRLEAAVADWWADEHGVAITEPDVMYRHGRLLATLDRRIVGADYEALEVKTTRDEIDSVHEHWWWQAQAQAVCADLYRVHFAVLDGTMDLKPFTVERDDEAIARLVEAVDRVWAFLELGMVPEGVLLSDDHVAHVYPKHESGTWVDLDDNALATISRWADLRARRIDAEKREKVLRGDVARIIGEAEGARYKGLPVATWRAGRPVTKLDVKALVAKYPRAAAKFERTVPGSRRMLPAKELQTFDLGGES